MKNYGINNSFVFLNESLADFVDVFLNPSKEDFNLHVLIPLVNIKLEARY